MEIYVGIFRECTQCILGGPLKMRDRGTFSVCVCPSDHQALRTHEFVDLTEDSAGGKIIMDNFIKIM